MIYSPLHHSKPILDRKIRYCKKKKKKKKRKVFINKIKANGVRFCLESNVVHTNFLYVLQKKESLERHEGE